MSDRAQTPIKRYAPKILPSIQSSRVQVMPKMMLPHISMLQYLLVDGVVWFVQVVKVAVC